MTQQNEAKYRVGVIGCGRKGTSHARAYDLNPLTEVVAAADPDPANLQLFARRFGLTAAYSSYGEMLAKEQIDIAAPILPVSANPDAVVACAKAGVKAIFCEKPISASLLDADRMVEECRSRGVKLASGDAYRNFPQLWTARELIDSGEIGDVQSLNVYAPTSEISGGGCQDLSVMRLFAGDSDIDWVVGWVMGDPASDEDQGMGGHVRFSNGTEAFIHSRTEAKKGIEVMCSRGVFFCDWYSFRLWKLEGDGPPSQLADLIEVKGLIPDSGLADQRYDADGWRWPGNRQMASVQSIVDSLERDIEPRCSGDNMRKALEIAIALRESHRRGHAPVHLPLEDRSLKIVPAKGRWLNKKDVYGEEWYGEQISKHKVD